MNSRVLKFIFNHKISLLMALIFSIFTSFSTVDYKDQYNQLSSDKSTLENKIKELNSNTTISNLENEISALKEKNKNLDSDLQSKTKKISELEHAKAEKERIAKEAAEKAELAAKTNASSSNNLDSLQNSSGNSTPSVSSEIVYWTPGGSSYHKSNNCTTLKRSKTILNGSISESGKNDPCNVCFR